MEEKKFRITLGSFDFIKGYTTIFMILSHLLVYFNVAESTSLKYLDWVCWRSAFVLLMYYMISGYGFKGKPAKKMLKTTFKQLIIPYMLVVAAYALLYPATYYLRHGSWNTDAVVSDTIGYLLSFLFGIPKPGKIILGYQVQHCPVVWYLLSCFVAFNVLNLVLKIKNNLTQVLVVGVCVAIGYALIIRDINYFTIPQGLMAVGCCYIGYLIKKYKILERYLNCVWLYVPLILITLAHMVWGHFNLCFGEFRYGLLDYAAACCGAILFMFGGVCLGRFEWKGTDWIKQIGVYTYWILCIHSVENDSLPWRTLSNLISSQDLAFVIAFVIKASIIAASCLAVKKIVKYNQRRRMLLNGK